MDPLELRLIVYRHFVEAGSAPSREALSRIVGDLDTVDGLLRELHDRHMLVLDDRPHRRGEIRMALPASRWWDDIVFTRSNITFLRSKDNQPASGERATLAQMWNLSQPWYGDRLDESFTPRTLDATQRLLDDVGLTSAFWQLKP